MKRFSYFMILFLLVLSCRNDVSGPEKSEQRPPGVTFPGNSPLEVGSVTAVIKATEPFSVTINYRLNGRHPEQIFS